MTFKMALVGWVTMFVLVFAGVAPFEQPPRSLVIPAVGATVVLALVLLWAWAL